MALVWLLSNCYQKTSPNAANPHKYWVFTVLRFIPAQSSSFDNTSYIGESRAKEISLERAGVSASQATFQKVKLDYDDGRWEYEVEFRSGDYEYELTIDAVSGTILDYERDFWWD